MATFEATFNIPEFNGNVQSVEKFDVDDSAYSSQMSVWLDATTTAILKNRDKDLLKIELIAE